MSQIINVQITSEARGTSSSNNEVPKGMEKKQQNAILRVDQFYSRKDRQTHYAMSKKRDGKQKRFGKYAVVIRRIIDPKGLLHSIEIDIRSPELAEVLKEILKDAGTFMLASSETSPVVSPEALFLIWDQLEARVAEEKSRQNPDIKLLDDLSVALAYLEKDYGSTQSELKELLSDGLITYDLLGFFFMPNSALYTDKNELEEGQILRFLRGSYEEDGRKEKFYQVHASFISHDGERFGWGEAKIRLPFFKGKMKITDLNVFPFDKHPQQDIIQPQLTNRGRCLVSLLKGPVCKWYGAMAIFSKEPSPPGYEWEEAKFLSSKRVMIDPSAWMIHNYSRDVLRNPRVWGKALFLDSLGDEDLLFCSHRVLGFSFEEKRWGAFAVSKLKGPMWNETAFDKVILPQVQLGLIKDLVLSHRTRPGTGGSENDGDDDDDIIEGKGQGLIGLLSGNPGVGKTLTAEAVAEVSHRPLYAVSAGELGTGMDTVDRKLGLCLDITHRWRCMLLIDEADVFLRKRDDNVSLERNALVSIFLRRLEYVVPLFYLKADAILTTNRRTDIDVAFMSRIHFNFHYEDLNSSAMFCIWKNFLEKEISAPGGSINEADLRELANMYTLSGREIKKRRALRKKDQPHSELGNVSRPSQGHHRDSQLHIKSNAT
ncbi:hypothetical protein NM208_g7373 [Fusarium decemcellulare]|uniref:Uncharacterized protein n=1 Tax=Fusarium decemcellulare TaxID=57161 RepID=A0ACC1S9C1_9HYPO|nr:hypothetical protein NM208_g7373 [Fusarium decemcellulare]